MEIPENEMLIMYAQELMGRVCDGIITPMTCHNLFSSSIADGVPSHEQKKIQHKLPDIQLAFDIKATS